jgi:predicted deacetylase
LCPTIWTDSKAVSILNSPIAAAVDSPAQYLIRFDDICPTMHWAMWRRVEAVLLANKVRPILAIVPDNQDPVLMVDAPARDFWHQARQWHARGWTIAMHGHQHRYTEPTGGILPISDKSEFAGLPPVDQQAKLRAARQIFEREGLAPEAWVAPSHSFDWATVQALCEVGIKVISDGLARLPFDEPAGVTWVPHQMWRFSPRRSGVWTVGYHLNHWPEAEFRRFEADVERHRRDFTTLPSVVSRYRGRRRTAGDRWFQRVALLRLKVMTATVGLVRGTPPSPPLFARAASCCHVRH